MSHILGILIQCCNIGGKCKRFHIHTVHEGQDAVNISYLDTFGASR